MDEDASTSASEEAELLVVAATLQISVPKHERISVASLSKVVSR